MSPVPERSWPLPVGRAEFVAVMAALMALNALAIDIMLPGMQQIGASLGVSDENERQFVITAYLLGFGAMQLVFGPLSDRFGRKGPLLAGLSIYVLAALAAAFAPDFQTLLLLRLLQGAGAASTRVLTVAMVRDVAGGRAMAEIMSLVFMVFMIMPVVAPALGQAILLAGEWHTIFLFMGFGGAAVIAWMALRIPETLAEDHRRPVSFRAVAAGFHAVATNRMSLWYTLAMTAILSSLFGFINTVQQIYIGIYDLGTAFPLVFALVAGSMSLFSWLNSRIVQRFGMRRVSHSALLVFLATSTTLYLLSLQGVVPLPLFLGLFTVTMCAFGMLTSNFSSIAMEPLGRVAGIASSAQGFFQTTGSALIGAAIGQSFDGTITPVMAGFAAVSLAALLCVLVAERGHLFTIGPAEA
ncbi:MFS transporter [Zhengella mangrovi]|uniref:Bcr/CflA family efflux transporter n=1 Tax=Zhengella mangrovi TaxID=1982044 RepID=A0A2G1QM67_9HYPH|nr:multidrug effflux MFS transporter [Zhengella mangrovi]PHP66627.1 MFS transporter [Zhengella mangrovi]